MTSFDLTKFLHAFRLPTATWLAVLIGTSLLLALPQGALTRIGVDAYLVSHKEIIGLGWLVSISILLARLLLPVGGYLRDKIKHYVLLKQRQKCLADLSPRQKEILRGYLEADRKTQQLAVDDGDRGYLCAQGVLFQSSTVSDATLMRFAFSIQPWAWDHLKRNPKLIDWNGKVNNGKRAKRKTSEGRHVESF